MSSTISPEQVAERLGLDAKKLEEECHESSFTSLRNFIHPWRLVFSNLLTQVDLDDVESEHSSRPEEEKRLGCLRKWKARVGAKATFKVIVEAVLLSGSLANAEAICQHLLQQPEMSQDNDVVVQTQRDEGNTQSLSRAGVEMVRYNVEAIRALFASLLLSVQSALKKNSDVDDVRQFLITFFKCDFSTTLDLKELLSAVTYKRLWDYQHYSPLEMLANSLLSNDLEIEELIRAYKAHLSGFYLTTKLIDFIDCQQLVSDDSDDESDQPTPTLTTKQFKKIKVVLKLDRKISDLSLGYVQKLWRSLAVEYEIPSLTAVLDRSCPDGKTTDGKTILWIASYLGHTGIALLLLQHGTNIDLPTNDKFGETPLFAACSKGHLDTAAVLIKHGAVVNCLNKGGVTPLYHASHGGHTEVVELLLSSGADINKGQQSPLYAASLRGNFDVVKLLVHHRAEIDKPNDSEYGSTPLFAACDENHLNVAQLLIDNGANINCQAKQGWTPLQFACQEGHSAVVKLLIQSGAQLEIKNKEGRTALMVASWRGHLKIVMQLLTAGAKINPYDEEGLTALMLATQNGHVQVVQALLDVKADPNITESTAGWSALFFAAISGYLQIIKLLVGKGADIGIRDKTGLTAIEVSEDQDIIDELQRHKSETTTVITEDDERSRSEISQEPVEVPEDQQKIRDQDTVSKSQVVKGQNIILKQVQQTYQRLLNIFDRLEDSLRKDKKQQKGLHSNIVEANQQMLLDNN